MKLNVEMNDVTTVQDQLRRQSERKFDNEKLFTLSNNVCKIFSEPHKLFTLYQGGESVIIDEGGVWLLWMIPIMKYNLDGLITCQ